MEAEILLGAAMWLAQARDWLDEELSLARGRLGLSVDDTADSTALVSFKLSEVEVLQRGLSRALALVDTLAVDPSSMRALVGNALPQPNGRETLQ